MSNTEAGRVRQREIHSNHVAEGDLVWDHNKEHIDVIVKTK